MIKDAQFIRYWKVPKPFVRWVESYLIDMLKPPLNGRREPRGFNPFAIAWFWLASMGMGVLVAPLLFWLVYFYHV